MKPKCKTIITKVNCSDVISPERVRRPLLSQWRFGLAQKSTKAQVNVINMVECYLLMFLNNKDFLILIENTLISLDTTHLVS